MTTTTLGLRLNNPGHIERGDPWQGLAEVQSHPRFAEFTDPVWGLRAIARTLITYYDNRTASDGSKIDTTMEIAERWAPASDNNPTEDYAAFLARTLSVNTGVPHNAHTKIDVYKPETMRSLMKGIVKFETGKMPYSEEQIDRALVLSGIIVPPAPAAKDPALVASSAVAASTTLAALAGSSDTILDAMQGFIPYGKGFGLAFAIATAVFAAITVRQRLIERKRGKGDAR